MDGVHLLFVCKSMLIADRTSWAGCVCAAVRALRTQCDVG